MTRRALPAVALLLAALAASGTAIAPRAAAQGCAMCYQSAAAAGPRAIHALRNGIILLMIPPVLICAGISYLVYKRRDLYSEDR